MGTTNTQEFSLACRELVTAFFDKFPDERFRSVASQLLETFLGQQCDGKPGGWAGGLVYALTKWTDLGKHVILNSDMEAVFGTTMGTIRRRAEQVWQVIEADVTRLLAGNQHEFTLRDEANAMCAYAFRNGPIEDIHASVDSDRCPKITDPEMKMLMVDASSKLAKLLEMKAVDPKGYLTFLKKYHRIYCWSWER
jgi:hypothetical protein